MSIISFVLTAASIIGGIAAFFYAKQLDDTLLTDYNNSVPVFGAFLGFVMYVASLLLAVFAAIAACVTVLMGILGIACCKKQGKYSLGCLILGGLFSLLTAASIANSITDDNFEAWVMLVLVYFGLYTAGSAIVYIENKKDRN